MAASYPDIKGLMSSTGGPENASIFSTSMIFSKIDTILHRVKAIKFGRTGGEHAGQRILRIASRMRLEYRPRVRKAPTG